MDEREVVALIASLALQGLGHVRDDFFVLAVHGHDAAAQGHLRHHVRERTGGHAGAAARKDLEAGEPRVDGAADLSDDLGRHGEEEEEVEREIDV